MINYFLLVKNRIKGIYKAATEMDNRRSMNFDGGSVLSGTKRRIFDGTSEKELMKAMSTYLN